jgi:death-on-curing protein
MPHKIHFLTTAQVERLHAEVIRQFGGSMGLRDRGLFESACEMPRATFDDQFLHPTLAAMAAAYLFHLCSNHPFVDGNKRVGLGAALVFIEVNGRQLRASDDELEKLTLGVASGEVSKEQVTAFFAKRLSKVGAVGRSKGAVRRKGEDRRR